MSDDKFNETVEEIFNEYIVAEDLNWGGRWEIIKQEIKMSAIERSCVLKSLQRKTEEKLRSNINQLLKLESEMPGLFRDDIATIKSKLEGIDSVRYFGATVRARSECYLSGETPTKDP